MTKLNSAAGVLMMTAALGLTSCGTVQTDRPASAAVAGGTQVIRLPADRAEAIDNLYRTMTELGMFNGTVMIDIGGEIVFQRSYGFANYEHRVPFNDDTMFRVASLSKGMTDAALATMIVNGQLRLDSHVSDFLPTFPHGREITIEQLVKHTSGIPHTNDTEWGDGSQPLTLDDIVTRLAQMPLDFEPGAREQYSNGGFAVLTKIMEVASGETYPQFMQRIIFGPLGMHHTGIFGDSRAAIENLATGYEPGPQIGSRRQSRPYYPESRPGGGSIYASALDVMRFTRAAWRGRLPGYREYPDLFGGAEGPRGATGRAPGFNALLFNDREADIIVVVLSNNYSGPYRLAGNTSLLALGREPAFSVPQTDRARVTPANSPWLGRWRYQIGEQTVDVTMRLGVNGQLLSEASGDTSVALVPTPDGGYLDPMYQRLCSMPDPNRMTCRPFAEGGFIMELQRAP